FCSSGERRANRPARLKGNLLMGSICGIVGQPFVAAAAFQAASGRGAQPMKPPGKAAADRNGCSTFLLLLFTTVSGLEPADYKSTGFIAWPANARIGALSSLAVSRGHIFVLHRAEPPLLEFDGQGAYLRGWGEGLFKVAHGLRADPAGNLWTTDN